MLLAPIVGSFYLFANNYALKLLADAFGKSDHHFHSDLAKAIALFLGAQIIHSVMWRVSNIAEWRSEPFVRQSIINRSYDHVQHYSYKFFQDNYAGSVLSKLKGIIDGYDNFWAQMHHELTPRTCEVIVLISALAIVSTHLFIFMAIWCIVFFIIMFSMSKRLSTISFAETESKHSIFAKLSDNLTNIFSLFSFASRKQELQTLDRSLQDDFIPKQMKTYRYSFKIQVIGDVLYLVMLTTVFFYIIKLRNENSVTTGDLIFVLMTTLALSDRLWQMIIKMQDFIREMGDLKSSFSILQHPIDNIDKPNAIDMKLKKASITFKDVSFSYSKDNLIFEGLSLNIKNGEKVGIVGISGAGKSTLVGILLKQFALNSGKILIGNQDINDVTTDSLRRNIALIPQDILLFHRSIMENIRYGKFDASDDEVQRAAKMANLDHFINQLPNKYDTLVGERGVKLSGGQRQRIAIARAILKNAPILILDEASSSLDTKTEQLIQQSINLMLENKNFTIIAIAHRLSTLKHMDRIIVLDNGRIIEQGKHDDLIQNPKSLYKKLWEMQKI